MHQITKSCLHFLQSKSYKSGGRCGWELTAHITRQAQICVFRYILYLPYAVQILLTIAFILKKVWLRIINLNLFFLYIHQMIYYKNATPYHKSTWVFFSFRNFLVDYVRDWRYEQDSFTLETWAVITVFSLLLDYS